ncbi:Oidioi.mRNA.OKI2018_I69.chr2.g4051.t1.cds [Oikopleura dioica]|uniref:60S acidic ribosomal protein P0 n=1 Tax=Oikopleura dioica TaxID=34765 RepID=A0ABN7T0D4_OIKDI|nr:Oidioi.mRNA.OKI2018_I69.chr2.g4051.t1.cds [Oikopleura dioica]
MVLGRVRKEWKAEYFQKVERILSTYDRVLVCDADNVTSKQFQQIRTGLRGQGEILMGKNTMMKRAMRSLFGDKPELEKLMNLVKLNVGLVCFNGDMKEIRDLVMTYKVPAAARTGAVAPVDVVVPPQVTTLGPEKTSFFQALSVPTKITRGNIEITAPVNLIAAGDKVGESAATLLNMLKISPFTYGLDVIQCYDAGSVYSPEILDITEDDIKARFMGAVANVASVSLAIGYPTAASAPHSIANAFKNIQAVAAVTEITFPQVEKLKEYLANPEAFAVAAPAAAAAAEEAAPAAVESEESSDEDMGMDLFG